MTIPGYVHSYTVTGDDGYVWLTCDHCETPLAEVEAGVSLETLVTRARDHERVCMTGRTSTPQGGTR